MSGDVNHHVPVESLRNEAWGAPALFPGVQDRSFPLETEGALYLRLSTPSAAAHELITSLEVDLRNWLVQSNIISHHTPGSGRTGQQDVQRFLAQRHVDLIAHAWGAAPYGPHLSAAAKWLIITWVVDDHFDDIWIHEPAAEAQMVVSALTDILTGKQARPLPRYPIVTALAKLWDETCELTTPAWQARYRNYYGQYLEASLQNLIEFEQKGTVPRLAEYLYRRDRDGAVLCAAGWNELAYNLQIPDSIFYSEQIFDILMRFNHVICWVNDLYSAPSELAVGNGKSLICSLVAYKGLTPAQAATRVTALCNAELDTLELLADAVVHGPGWDPATRSFVRALKRFTRALADWTAETKRYRLAPSEGLRRNGPNSPPGPPTGLGVGTQS